MKQFVLLFICICKSLTGAFAQSVAPVEQKQMQATVTGLFDALAELNVDKAKSFCTPGISILESGKIWTFDSLALRISTRKAQSPDFNRINKLVFTDTRAFGETAWLSYFNEATISFSGKTVMVRWLESVVLRKIGRDWKIDLLHSTEISRSI